MDNGAGQPGPEESSARHPNLEDLARRVSILEQHLDETSQRSLKPELSRTKALSTVAQPSPAITTAATPSAHPIFAGAVPRGLGLTSYLGAAVVKASDALLEYDGAARAGDAEQTAHWAEQVARVSCLGLSRIIDEFDFDDHDPGSEDESNLLYQMRQAGGLSSREDLIAFREQEVAILKLIGLSEALAASFVDDLAGVFLRGTRTSGPLGQRAEDAQRSVCALHNWLVADREQRALAPPPAGRRKRLWTAVIALGGGLLFVANAAAGTAIFGPAGAVGGAAASQYIGASAWDLASVYLRD